MGFVSMLRRYRPPGRRSAAARTVSEEIAQVPAGKMTAPVDRNSSSHPLSAMQPTDNRLLAKAGKTCAVVGRMLVAMVN